MAKRPDPYSPANNIQVHWPAGVPVPGRAPYQPPPIPSGFYDPALDAQRNAASRGLNYLQQDVGLAGRRAQEDLGYETGQINLGADRGLQDLTLGRDRSMADLSRDRGYENVDYGRNVEALTRNYGQLGRRQAEQSRRYGVTSSGIALLSAAKRNENMGLERRDLDTGHERAQTGYQTALDRSAEDWTIGSGRIGEDRASALGRAGTLYDRGVGDRGTQLARAQGEDAFYGLDIGEQKSYQARQAGYEAPLGPDQYEYDARGRRVRRP